MKGKNILNLVTFLPFGPLTPQRSIKDSKNYQARGEALSMIKFSSFTQQEGRRSNSRIPAHRAPAIPPFAKHFSSLFPPLPLQVFTVRGQVPQSGHHQPYSPSSPQTSP